MRIIATKKSNHDSAKHKKNEDRVQSAHNSASLMPPVLTRSRSISPLSTGMPLLQRQCACGGGCPRCQDELGIQHVTQQISPIVQRTPTPDDPSSSPLISPSLARFLGSLVLDRFTLDRATLTRQHQVQLAEFAQTLLMLLRNYPSGIIRITGHADATSSESHNLGLGQHRADAVRDALVLAGVPETRIITMSTGEEELRIPTQRAEPRNRRVEVQFQPESVVHLLSQPPVQLPPQPSQEPERPLDLRPRLPVQPETLEERINRILREPVPERPRRSFNDLFWERVDEGLDDVMDRVDVPESLRPWVRRGVRAAIERGAEEIFDRVADEVGLDDTQTEVIRTVIEATMAQPVF